MIESPFIIDSPSTHTFRVNRRTMTSPGILDREWRAIFDRVWLYVGHESEVERPGEYRRRTVGGRPIIFIRGEDGSIRTLLNTCTHRGALVCRQDRGLAKTFQCFYHAWTYDNTGQLVGVPESEGYGPAWDKSAYALQQPPRMDSYRGFHFISFNDEVEDLHSYLAGAIEYIDLVVDQADEGMRILAGSQEFGLHANWKLYIENSFDIYHAVPVHQTYFEYLASQGGGIRYHGRSDPGRSRPLGNGHAVAELQASYGRPIARWDPLFGEESKPEIERKRAELVEAQGEERAYRMADTIRLLLVYPNLILDDIPAITVRMINPVRPDFTEVSSWALAPREEVPTVLQRRLDSFLAFIGPGGFATPDDVEAVESCQAGFGAHDVQWSDLSRGMQREADGEPTLSRDEAQMRSFWRQWNAHVTGVAAGTAAG